MVFKHSRNMLGDTTAVMEEKSSNNSSNNIAHNPHSYTNVKEQAFLNDFGKHVHQTGGVPTSSQQKTDNLARVAGFGIGVGSLYLQEALGYPFIVLRRQCQVNHGAVKYHILPFSLFKVIGRIHQRQGTSVFWKGWGTNCIVKGVTIVTEVLTAELLNFKRKDNVGEKKDDNSSISNVKKKSNAFQEFVKGLSAMLLLPLQSAALTDSVQSLTLHPVRSIFTFFIDAFERVLGWYTSRGHGRLLPIRQLILPSLCYGLVNYAVKYTINTALMHYNTKRCSLNDRVEERNMRKIYYAQLMTTWLSALITDVITYPLETVLLRIHLQGTRTIIDDMDKGLGVVPLCTNYDGVNDCVMDIVQYEGVGGLYKGFGALLLQYFVQFCIVKLSRSLYCN